MANCGDNTEKRGSSNPIQSKIVVNDHGGSNASSGDNTIEGATCDSSVYVGAIVRMDGNTFVNAQADSFNNSKVIGICVSKDSATICDIQVTGFTADIFSGLVTNSLYFLSEITAGGLTTTPPSVSGQVVQLIGKPRSANSLVINFTTGMIRT